MVLSFGDGIPLFPLLFLERGFSRHTQQSRIFRTPEPQFQEKALIGFCHEQGG